MYSVCMIKADADRILLKLRELKSKLASTETPKRGDVGTGKKRRREDPTQLTLDMLYDGHRGKGRV